MSTLKRIKEYIDYKGVNIKRFEESVGFSNGAFASQLKNDKTIGVDKLENILAVYSEVNPEWLLTGEGSMLKGEHEVSSRKGEDVSLIRELIEKNGELRQRLGELIKENEVLTAEIENLKNKGENKNPNRYSIHGSTDIASEQDVKYK